MASIFGHALAAYTLGKGFPKNSSSPKFWILGIACAILPDADVISFAFGIPYESFWGHRGFSHSIIFAILLGFLITFLFYNKELISKTGVLLISPFDNTRYFFPWRPIQVSPIGASKFFSMWGIKVLLSELIWIGIPSSIYIFVVYYVIKRKNQLTKQKKSNS